MTLNKNDRSDSLAKVDFSNRKAWLGTKWLVWEVLFLTEAETLEVG